MSNDGPKYIPRRPERLILPDWAAIAVGVVVLALLVGGVFLVIGLVRRGREGRQAPSDVMGQPTAFVGPEPTQLPGIAGFQVWRGDERVTVLVMGVDGREFEEGAPRTDTMLLLSLDPESRTGAMLSIPRDLWVDIPGVGFDRINTANVHGEANRYPGGGPALAMDTIEQNFGVEIDHYVLLNFSAFVNLVDAIGCINLDVPEDIADPTYPDAYYGYDPFYMSAGHHDEVCGEEALKYARTRATFGGDFDRASRQQQVAYAVRDQLLKPGRLPSLLTGAPDIWNSVQDGMRTDMTLDQMVGLGLLAKDIPDGSIQSAVLDGRYTESAITQDDRYILIPDDEAIRILVRSMFSGDGPSASAGPSTEELASLAGQEGATVSVLNGTPSEGLAEMVGRALIEDGLDVTGVGEAGRIDYTSTIIYDNAGKPNTARYVAKLLGVPDNVIVVTGDLQAPYDVQVVLGSDVLQ